MKIDINNKDWYFRFEEKENTNERTKNRLKEIIELGFEEVSIAQFGIQNVISGLYIERIWNEKEESWEDYIEWVKSVISQSKLKHDILIAEFDERKFKPYNGNRSQDIEFKTFKECENYIEKNNLVGFKPELGWEMGLGDYRTNFHSLMRVVEKICKEKFDDGENVQLRTFGMLDEESLFMVRFERHPLFKNESLIEATFEAVICYLRNKK